MAASLSFSFPSTIRASSVPHSTRKPDSDAKKPGSSSWWAPIFGISSDPDYITGNQLSSNTKPDISVSDLEMDRVKPKFKPGCFTDDKAKQLRMKMRESSTFHDIMYHSAIASRLASDISGQSEK